MRPFFLTLTVWHAPSPLPHTSKNSGLSGIDHNFPIFRYFSKNPTDLDSPQQELSNSVVFFEKYRKRDDTAQPTVFGGVWGAPKEAGKHAKR